MSDVPRNSWNSIRISQCETLNPFKIGHECSKQSQSQINMIVSFNPSPSSTEHSHYPYSLNSNYASPSLSQEVPLPFNSSTLYTNLTITQLASVSANCWPIHIRGPPLNGKYSHPVLLPSQRSGRKSLASGPQSCPERWITCIEYTISSPARTQIGSSPAGPPPLGKVVSTKQRRTLTGTTGKRRNVSLMTCCRYVHDLSSENDRFLG